MLSFLQPRRKDVVSPPKRKLNWSGFWSISLLIQERQRLCLTSDSPSGLVIWAAYKTSGFPSLGIWEGSSSHPLKSQDHVCWTAQFNRNNCDVCFFQCKRSGSVLIWLPRSLCNNSHGIPRDVSISRNPLVSMMEKRCIFVFPKHCTKYCLDSLKMLFLWEI